ncbi:MAG TPA: hydrogenase maturation protease [Polyangia bacterium]|jgi:hydrogenase maturation protease|nr:hydrogenase maturation protease [Polyangia bacterium]
MKSDGARILVAGLGDVFHGDAGLGVQVARRLLEEVPPPGVTVADVGVRSLHLAYAMLERPDLLLVIDAVRRGERPGTVYLIDVSELGCAAPHEVPPTCGLNAHTVVTACWTLGGKSPPILLAGCEPELVGEGTALSGTVTLAQPKIERLVRATVGRWLGSAAGQPMLIDGIAKSSQDGVWFPSLDG